MTHRASISTILALALAMMAAGCQNKGEESTQTSPPASPPGPAAPGPTAPGGAMKGEPSPSAGSAVLTSKVKNALMTQGVDTTKVEVVTTPDGVVLLKGSVHKPEQKQMAEKAAKKVPGVKSVKDELTVVP